VKNRIVTERNTAVTVRRLLFVQLRGTITAETSRDAREIKEVLP